MPFTERWPEIVVPNPGGVDDPLGESVLDHDQSWLRVFEPRDLRLVIGRHQDPERELLVAAAQADGVPIHRRVCGGGAVVLAPGMVVVALRLPRAAEMDANCYFGRINAALIPAVAGVAGVEPSCRGHGDLAVVEDGHERKILGASLRQTSRGVYYLGVLLVADVVAQMERYLAAPSREPEYRAGRGHGAFCTHLGGYGVTVGDLVAAVVAECRQRLAPAGEGEDQRA